MIFDKKKSRISYSAVAIFIALLPMTSPSPVMALGNFDDCGVLQLTGDGCIIFVPDNHPGRYSLDNYGGFGIGDRVHVSGLHDSNYFCECKTRCIRRNIITLGCSTLCSSVPSDVNNDGRVNIVDITYLIGYIFLGAETPPCLEQGDCNLNGRIEISDLTCLIQIVF